MLSRICQFENDRHLWIKAFALLIRKIFPGIKDESIHAGRSRYLSRNQIRDSAVRVRLAFADQLPTSGGFNFQRDGNTLRWPSARSVEYVGRDSTH